MNDWIHGGSFAAVLAVLLGFGLAATAAKAQTPQPSPSAAPTYPEVMNRLSQPYLDRRVATMAGIHTREQAEARQAWVRATLLRLIGGLPKNAGPLNATVVGTIPEDGFHIERILYDSLPGYHVTANLYLPDSGKGPFPAILYHAGHGPWGKSGAFEFGANMARDGFAVLAYDPLGAGERLQAMNPATGKSWAGPDEHSQAEIPIELIGDSVASYMVWDAMRGIDYLDSRPDIDAKNIGSFGCSGGGTLSAYLTALDPRVKAGVVACYITSYQELLKTIGPQDGEQVFPGLIKDGLDFADLVELAAPRAYAMVSTTEDMFPFAGARASHDEAEHFYSLLGAGNNLQWFTGPGHHGAIRPMMPKIVAFFQHWLEHNDNPPPAMVNLKRPSPQELWCTTTGQVTTALPGRTIYQINRDRARAILPTKAAVSTRAELAQLQTRLKKEIPAVTGMNMAAGPPLKITVTSTQQRPGYRMETAVFHGRYGMDLPARIALPDKKGRRPALLITSYEPIDTLAATGGNLDRAARDGRVVLLMTPLPWPPSANKAKPTLGAMLPWTSRALLVGKTFVGMRAEDMLAAAGWLASQREVNPDQIDAYGQGASGVVLLHVAVLDPQIRRVTVEGALASYQAVLDAPVHRNVTESVIPDVMLHYDLDDLMIAIAPRPVTVIDPVDGGNKPIPEAVFRTQFARVYAADRSLGMPGRLQFATRQPGQGPPSPASAASADGD